APVLIARRRRVGDAQPAARRVAVGEHVETTVAPDVHAGLGVDVDLDGNELGTFGRARVQIRQPQVVARRGAPLRRDGEPTTVPADAGGRHLRLVPALAEDQHVVVRGRADGVQVDA